ncbi:MAG TPA: hypothetical protein VL401_00615 [Alphaproteobacteria bacterium]|jgi:hypothetical protein|nr:hypothetical protein [Alphaproteobacteria bacterium]
MTIESKIRIQDRFTPEYCLIPPTTEYQKKLEKLGVHSYSVDITPQNLKNQREFIEQPLTVTFVELSPTDTLPNSEMNKDQIQGMFFNTQIHNEGAAANLGVRIMQRVAEIRTRYKPVVIAAGLAECVQRLEYYLGYKVVDINRKFIQLTQTAQDPFEELAQNYGVAIVNRYLAENYCVSDIHGDGEEKYLKPNFIIDRLANSKNKGPNYHDQLERENENYDWFRKNFPNISVIKDVRARKYFESKLDQSLPAFLLSAGFAHTATLECSAGKSPNPKREQAILDQIMIIMQKNQILFEAKIDMLKNNLPTTVNNLFKSRWGSDKKYYLRMGDINFSNVDKGGTLNIPPESFEKVLMPGDLVGTIVSLNGGPSITELRVPNSITVTTEGADGIKTTREISAFEHGLTLMSVPELALVNYREAKDPSFDQTPGINIMVAVPDLPPTKRKTI